MIDHSGVRGISLDEVICRTSLCRVKMRFASVRDALDFKELSSLPNYDTRSYGYIKYGEVEATIYIARENEKIESIIRSY